MAEPIKCPFCGRIPTVEDCGTNRWFVRCQCGIAQDKLYHQRCDAVRAWNRRKSVTDVPSAQLQPCQNHTKKAPESDTFGVKAGKTCSDTISKQVAIDALNRHLDTIPVVNNNTMETIRRSEVMDCREIINGLPSAQAEPLTDKEQRIFLAAMGREEKVCKQVDDEYRDCMEPYEDSLVRICHEITRKVKGALWT